MRGYQHPREMPQQRRDPLGMLSQLLQIGGQAQALQDQTEASDYAPQQRELQNQVQQAQLENMQIKNEQMPLAFDQDTQKHVAEMQRREFEMKNLPIMSQLEQAAMKQRQQIGEEQLQLLPLERQRTMMELQNAPQQQEQNRMLVTARLAHELQGLGVPEPHVSAMINKNLGLPSRPEQQYVEDYVRARRPDLMSVLDQLNQKK